MATEKKLKMALAYSIAQNLELNNNINETINKTNSTLINYLECRRKLRVLIKLLCIHNTSLVNKTWVYPKNLDWWGKIAPIFTPSQWKSHFRVEKTTFEFILKQVKESFERVDTKYRKSVPVEKKVAACLYMLSSSAELRTIAELFGIGKSTLSEALHEFCSIVIDKFLESEIALPKTNDEMLKLITDFQRNCDFPQCFGAVDGTHIAVSPPKINASDYYNYKCFYSIVLLAMCDSNYKFLYINAGSPGRNNDSFIYRSSQLFNFLKNSSSKFNSSVVLIEDVLVPPLVLGDAAFPLQPNLMKPYPGLTACNEIQRNFNYRQASARRVIENAFGRLKARFRIIAKRNEFKISNVTQIVKACCILHNLCEKQKDVPCDSWLENICLNGDGNISVIGNTNKDSQNVRNALANSFL